VAEWEVQITVLHNGVEVKTSDALGETASSALYFAHNDLELWAQSDAAEVSR
jgi:hypothetical protein